MGLLTFPSVASIEPSMHEGTLRGSFNICGRSFMVNFDTFLGFWNSSALLVTSGHSNGNLVIANLLILLQRRIHGRPTRIFGKYQGDFQAELSKIGKFLTIKLVLLNITYSNFARIYHTKQCFILKSPRLTH